VNTLVENQFFQDPLIKTIKYLESIETKEHHNVVQFLTGLSRILEKFDKRTCVRKIIPLMLKCVNKEDLSILILPAFIKMIKKENFMSKEQFYEYAWPNISRLCQAGELQAQALYILVDNLELFHGLLHAKDFQDILFPLLLKSLECGVHKLQGLGVQKIPFLSKKIEYMTFKSQLMPRFLSILTNKDIPLNLKEQGCEVLIQILSVLDRNFLRDNILKTLQALRDSINEPTICMHILTLYSGIAGTLTPEDIGNKILPGLIPMLISASFTKVQFSKLISTIRTLIDQLEKHRLKDLSEMDPLGDEDGLTKSKQKDIFAGLSSDDPLASLPPQENAGDFDFLSQIEGTGQMQTPKKSAIKTANPNATPSSDPFSGFGGGTSKPAFGAPAGSNKNDIFKGIGTSAPNVSQSKPVGSMSLGGGTGMKSDPFDTSSQPIKSLSKPNSTSGQKKDIFSGMDPFSGSSNQNSNTKTGIGGMPSVPIKMSTGFGSIGGGDPFAELENDSKDNQDSGFGNLGGFTNSTSKPSNSFNQGTKPQSNFGGQSSSNPFSDFGSSGSATQNKKQTSNSAFDFGGGSSAAKPTSSSGLDFGGNSFSKPANNSGSGFGSGSSASKPASSSPFDFGSGSSGSKPAASSSFDFGGSSSTLPKPPSATNTGYSRSSDPFGGSSAPPASNFPSSSSDPFGSLSSGVSGSSTAFGGPQNTGFGTTPATQSTGMGFSSGIDMNKPMDQNTMNMMMNMMSNFTNQMNNQNNKF